MLLQLCECFFSQADELLFPHRYVSFLDWTSFRMLNSLHKCQICAGGSGNAARKRQHWSKLPEMRRRRWSAHSKTPIKFIFSMDLLKTLRASQSERCVESPGLIFQMQIRHMQLKWFSTNANCSFRRRRHLCVGIIHVWSHEREARPVNWRHPCVLDCSCRPGSWPPACNDPEVMSIKPANTAATLRNAEFDRKKWADYPNFELKCDRSCYICLQQFTSYHITKEMKTLNLVIRLLSRVDLLVCLLGSAKYSTGRVKLKTVERFFCMPCSLEPWYF